LLGQQFFGNDKYVQFIHENFVPIHAIPGEGNGEEIEEKFEIGGHPSVAIVKPDGSLSDIIAGYKRDPDNYFERVKGSLKGIDTYASIKAQHDQDPDNLEKMFALANKHSQMYQMEKAAAMSQKVLERADEAKTIDVTFQAKAINLYEAANYSAGYGDMYSKRSTKGLEAFRAEFPKSALIDGVYSDLANFYLRLPVSKKSDAFYADLKKMYPENPSILNNIVRYYIKTGKNLDEGERYAKKLIKLAPESGGYRQNAANLFLKNNKKSEALEAYGTAYILKNMEDANLLTRYARFWADKEQNLESALQSAKKVVELKPDARTWNVLAAVHRKMKNYQNALVAVNRAVELDPENEDAREHLELIQKEMNNK